MVKFGFALLLAATSLNAAADKIEDQVRYVNEQDKNMNLAIAEARRTLDDFLALFKNPPAGADNFKLKVMLSDDNGIEHMWFIPFKKFRVDGVPERGV
jgi:uncharacterized protein YegJ (DUF2314 family)